MPTLPMLMDPPMVPGAVLASRGVFAPGGYEWWRVEARSADGGRVEADFCLGGIGRSGWKAYRRYLCRPTHRPPPLPRSAPVLQWRVYDRDGVRVQGRDDADPAETEASGDRLAVRIGPGRIEQGDDGTIRLGLAPADGPEIHLELRPRWQGLAHARPLLHDVNRSENHWWACDGVVHDVEGSLSRARDRGGEASFRGVGLCSYHYGTRPLAVDVRWWLRACVCLPDRLVIGDVLEGAEQATAGARGAVEFGREAVRPVPLRIVEEGWSGSGLLRPRWPLEMELGAGIRLTRPRRVDSSIGHALLTYDVAGLVETEEAGEPVVSACSIRQPRLDRR